ncbi:MULTISPECIES: hypothetical protein [unclassified Kitasatospora]|uniref:hypothetical protein n=1 Tax=unclassified Kitasatospora TaxID=2633591 RepID=UPI00068BF713|nr:MULTISPECIES: hypothetical protein [unclassified Kitasatospora]
MPLDPRNYRLDLGRVLSTDVPLGPLAGIPLSCFTASSRNGKLHGKKTCGSLRSSRTVEAVTVKLGEAAERLCGTCFWPMPFGDPLVTFTNAVRDVLGVTSYTGPDPSPDVDFDPSKEADAAAVLAQGDYPRGDEHDEAESDRYARARFIRERHHGHWRHLHDSMLESNSAVAAHPWLATWAKPTLDALAAVIESERHAFAALLRPDALLDSAAITRLEPPHDLASKEGFTGLGDQAAPVLRRAWDDWAADTARSWLALEDDRSSASLVLHGAFGQRRKGRDEAYAALDELVASWCAQARSVVDMHKAAPRRLLAVSVPPTTFDSYLGRSRDPLSQWEAGVLAMYQVATNWPDGTVALLVPQLIAERLISDTDIAMPVTALDTREAGFPIDRLLVQLGPAASW